MEMDGISSELNTNGFIVLNRPFENQATQGLTPNKFVQLTTHLQAAVDEVWPHRFGLRYRNVKVLLVSWEADDLGVIKEVRALEHVFRDFYRYDVSTYLITSHHPDRALTRRVIEFVDSAMKDTLLIFYYAGHASMNPNRLESVIWSARRQRYSPALTSNGIQSLFEAADCDVLILYDCCHSADTAIAPAHSLRGSTELIAACGFEAIAAEVGEHSFTNALIEVLVLCSSMSSFSVSQLHSRIIQQLKNWRPSPRQDDSGRFVRDLHGRLVMEPQRRRTPVYCNLTHEGGRKQIMLSCMPLAPAVESFTPPLNNQSMSMGMPFSPAVVTNPETQSNSAASSNIDMIITVKMASEVVDGRQEADFDAWLEWLRSAPPEATQLEMNVGESACWHAEPTQGDFLPSSVDQSDSQLEVPLHTTVPNVSTPETSYHNHNGNEPYHSSTIGWPDPHWQFIDGIWQNISLLSSWRQVPPSECFRRGPWSEAEDASLLELVHTKGALNWVRIAQLMGSRSPKQCLDRYHQNFEPSLSREPITPEEGLEIERLVGEMGKQWDEVAQRLPGRSDNDVKNWWSGSMNRRNLVLRQRTPDQYEGIFDKRNQQLLPSWSVATTDGITLMEG